MWRSSAALVLAATTILAAPARSEICLPPIYESGKRLQAMPAPDLFWLELLLRQHEVCWRAEPEARIFVFGNSGPTGFPLPADQTFVEILNAAFRQRRVPAHLFNLGFNYPYQLKDALIVSAALGYEPDAIVYPLTLDDYQHVAPAFFPGLTEFMEANLGELNALATHHPPGLAEPIAAYQAAHSQRAPPSDPLWKLRQLGSYVRSGVRRNAVAMSEWLSGRARDPRTLTRPPDATYDCTETKRILTTQFKEWQRWNILAYLAEVQRTRGVPVLILNWPMAANPVGDCYNARSSLSAIDEFDVWLRDQTTMLGLMYLDLRTELPSNAFLDSLHLSAEGHRAVAAALQPALDMLLRQVDGHRPDR